MYIYLYIYIYVYIYMYIHIRPGLVLVAYISFFLSSLRSSRLLFFPGVISPLPAGMQKPQAVAVSESQFLSIFC